MDKPYKVAIVAYDRDGEELTRLVQNLDTYTEFVAYQRLLANGVFAGAEAKAAKKDNK